MVADAFPFDAEISLLQWQFAAIASLAGIAVMEVYTDPQRTVRHKSDGSPVCDADERAEDIILDQLAQILPGVPVIAEETSARNGTARPQGETFLLVDPVDGTREFVKGTGEFTINIALVHEKRPVLGCVYAPALGDLYLGNLQEGSSVQASGFLPGHQAVPDNFVPIQARAAPEAITLIASRSHLDSQTESLIQSLPIDTRMSAGSSLKFCVLATGQADLYPRFGTTMEWDTAAGQAVLQAAGGQVRELDGATLLYNKQADGFKNRAFMAYGTDGYARFGDMIARYGENYSD